MSEKPAEAALEDRSLGELVALASRDLSFLVKSEIALAKIELAQDVRRAGAGGALFGLAGFLGVLVLVFALVALALGIAAAGLPAWAGFLIVAAACLLLSGVLAVAGKRRLTRMTKIRRTRETLKDDLSLLRREGVAASGEAAAS